MQDEIEHIKQTYNKRKNDKNLAGKYEGAYTSYATEEREAIYDKIIRRDFSDLNKINVLEVGAGTGGNLSFFHDLGIPYSNLFANELLEDRLIKLKANYPEVNVLGGNALEIIIDRKFDIVFQSTVFTSILSDSFRKQLSDKMWELLNDQGIILWYDFVYDNPQNKNVKKVTKKEIKSLFPNASKIEFYRVTLAPPIGRRVGALYSFFNRLKFLRTHLIAVIHK